MVGKAASGAERATRDPVERVDGSPCLLCLAGVATRPKARDGEIWARGAPREVITEEPLASVFRIDAVVERTDRGPRITPLNPRHEGTDSSGESAGDREGATRV